jgi:glucose-6-phosphate 1-epimerase
MTISDISLSHADASAMLAIQGAHLFSWRPAPDDEVMFVSALAQRRAGVAIRGGVPVIFPQFADLGPLPKHGFARTIDWAVVDRGPSSVTLRLDDTATTRALWPHAFSIELSAALDDRLSIALAVRNRGDAPFEFTAALHTYFRVGDIATTRIGGLDGLRYRDKVTGRDGLERSPELGFAGETDRVYLDAPSRLELRDPTLGRVTTIETRGFGDAVVWNPWIERSRDFKDLAPDDYRRFVCIEPAVIGRPVTLAPDEQWLGEMEVGRRGLRS